MPGATFPPTSPPPEAPTVSRPSVPSATGPVARWVVAGCTAATTAFLAGYIYLVDPNDPTQAYPKCPLKLATGIDCPGCGGLRATHALLHGDIGGMLSHNLLVLFIVPVLAYVVWRWVFAQFGKSLPVLPTRPFLRWAVPVFLLVFTIVRNIPNTPLYYLNSA